MDRVNAVPDEMRPTTPSRPGFDPLSLDPSTAGRLLDGLAADDVPPAYTPVARLLAALRAPAQDGELSGESAAVAAFAAVGPQPHPAPRTRASVWGLRKVKVAVASVVGGLTLTTGLAAAGALPGPAQGFAADALSHVGITVPDPNADARGSGGAGRTRGADESDSRAPAERPDTHGSDVSDKARSTDAEGRDKGAEVSDTASNGKSRAGEPRPPAERTETPASPDGPRAKPAEAPAPAPSPERTTEDAPAEPPRGEPAETKPSPKKP